MLKTKNIGLFLGPLSFVLILFFFHPDGLNPQANAVLASTAWVSIWWSNFEDNQSFTPKHHHRIKGCTNPQQ